MRSLHTNTESQPRRQRALLWLSVAWAGGLALVVLGRLDGVDPSRPSYGANYPGDMTFAVVVISVVVLLLFAILCLRPDRARAVRAVLALAVALVTVAFTFVASTHAGTILIGMFLWSLPLALGAAVNALLALGDALAARGRRAT